MAAAGNIPGASTATETAQAGLGTAAGRPVLLPWGRAQSLNVTRHAAALRPFRREEFGTDAAAPTEGHIQAVNKLMNSLRRGLLGMASKVGAAAAMATQE